MNDIHFGHIQSNEPAPQKKKMFVCLRVLRYDPNIPVLKVKSSFFNKPQKIELEEDVWINARFVEKVMTIDPANTQNESWQTRSKIVLGAGEVLYSRQTASEIIQVLEEVTI